MKALITGIAGFAGSHLAEYLLQKGVEVYGTIRQRSRLDNIKPIISRIRLVECELKDPFSVESTLGLVKPDLIFHLASQSYVPSSWNSPAETIHNNIDGQLNLFEAVRSLGINCKILIACSSEEYGYVDPWEVPINEDHPLHPINPYAVSKIAQDYLGYVYYKSFGLHIVRVRAFNHTGPRRGEGFVTSNFSKQIAEIEKGKRPPVIFVGNLTAKRDFTDVRDVVRAYWLALEKAVPGEVYNISSGKCWPISDILQYLLSCSKVKIEIREDRERFRPSDVKIMQGDHSRFGNATGWAPEIPLEQTLLDLLNYWREKP